MDKLAIYLVLAVAISSLTTYVITNFSFQNSINNDKYIITSETTAVEIDNEPEPTETKSSATAESVKVEESCKESCNDGNPCTYEYCNKTTDFKCKYTVLKGEVEGCKGMEKNSCYKNSCVSGSCTLIYSSTCCGNGKCDADESYELCPSDCEQPQQAATETQQNSTQSGQQSTTVESKENCDPSYPDVCIPPPPPDLDCKDISYKKFRVLPPDPHRFDGNKNGIGC